MYPEITLSIQLFIIKNKNTEGEMTEIFSFAVYQGHVQTGFLMDNSIFL